MRQNSFYIIALSCIIFSQVGCSKEKLNEKPPHLITTESLYSTYEGFQTGINGCYSLMRDELDAPIDFYQAMFTIGTDNMIPNYRQGFGDIAYSWGSNNNPTRSSYSAVFDWLYRIVNSANTIIGQAEKRQDVDWTGGGTSAEDNKNKVIAEAKAIRAWAYRHLSYSWGDVPLSLEESLGSTIKTDWYRAPVAEVRNQILADLTFAHQYIPVEASLPGRMTKGAVQHYIAEMYLTVKKPDSALFWANKVISTSAYKLITTRYGVKKNEPGVPFMDMFQPGNRNRVEGNTEALWVWQYEFQTIGGGDDPSTRANHLGRYMDVKIGNVIPLQITFERGGRGKAYSALTKWAIDAYEPQDMRGSNFAIRKFFILKDQAQNAPYPADKLPVGYKFGDTIWMNWKTDITEATWQRNDWPFSRKVEGTNAANVTQSPNFDDYIALRLADTYLIKAEAQLLAGSPGDAAQTINIIRRRSGASDVTASMINIDFILDERSRELVLEEERRFTLLRTDKLLERAKKYNHFGGEKIAEKDKLFPVPQSVIDANLTKEMTQNPGY
ncbi:RagB/SusD family nutrient uptake outer membrane protein [Flavitalea sp.]|nr:RagB/SusD family nutrient uptake outer membrane protein [Flavitalea sp.]